MQLCKPAFYSLWRQAFDPLKLLRKTDCLEVIGLNGSSSGLLAQKVSLNGVIKQLDNSTRQSLAVKEVDQFAMLAAGDRLSHRGRVACDDAAAYAHRLKQTPTENKRVAEIYVHARDLQKAGEIRAIQPADEVDASPAFVWHLLTYLR